MKPASLTGVLIEKTPDKVYTYLFENMTLLSTTKDQCLKYFAKTCGDIDEIMSKKQKVNKNKQHVTV